MFCILGDALDRFYLRFLDMRASLLILKQIIFVVLLFMYCFLVIMDLTIETILYCYMTIWLLFVNPGVSLMSVEHPKGDYFMFVVLFLGHIARLRLRLADFLHILYVDCYLRGFLLHDLCAILGNIDIVFGSVDR